MVNIFMNVKEARDYLMKHGEVYCLRWKPYTGKARILQGSFFHHEDLSFGNVELIKSAPTIKDLEQYVAKSGFKTVEALILVTREHYKKYGVVCLEELGLYRVTLIRPIEVKST